MKIIYYAFFQQLLLKLGAVRDSPGVDACKLAVPNPGGCSAAAESKALFSNAEIGSKVCGAAH